MEQLVAQTFIVITFAHVFLPFVFLVWATLASDFWLEIRSGWWVDGEDVLMGMMLGTSLYALAVRLPVMAILFPEETLTVKGDDVLYVVLFNVLTLAAPFVFYGLMRGHHRTLASALAALSRLVMPEKSTPEALALKADALDAHAETLLQNCEALSEGDPRRETYLALAEEATHKASVHREEALNLRLDRDLKKLKEIG